MPFSLKLISSLAVLLFGFSAFSEPVQESVEDEAMLLNIYADEAQYQLNKALKNITENPKKPNWRLFCYEIGDIEGENLEPLFNRHNVYRNSKRMLHDEALNGRYNELHGKLIASLYGPRQKIGIRPLGASKACTSEGEPTEVIRIKTVESVNLLLSTLNAIKLESRKNSKLRDIEESEDPNSSVRASRTGIR